MDAKQPSGGTSFYRTIPTRRFDEPTFVTLSDDAKLVELRLRLGPETTPIRGVARVGRAALAEAMGWETTRLEAAFAQLEAAGIVRADWRSRVVWMPAVLDENPPENQNVVKGWARHWAGIPDSPLKAEIHRALEAAIVPRGGDWAEAVGRLSVPNGTVPGTVSVTVAPRVPETASGIAPAPALESGQGEATTSPPTPTTSRDRSPGAEETSSASLPEAPPPVAAAPPPAKRQPTAKQLETFGRKQAIDALEEAWLAAHRDAGRPTPATWGAKERGQAWHLLGKLPGEHGRDPADRVNEAARRFRNAVAHTMRGSKYWRDRGVTVGDVLQRPDEFMQGPHAAPGAPSTSTATQPGSRRVVG